MGNRLIVINRDGLVFGHDVDGNDIKPAFAFTGSKVAFNHEIDRFVVSMGNRLIVITQSGDAFFHDVVDRDVHPPIHLNRPFPSVQARDVSPPDVEMSGDVFTPNSRVKLGHQFTRPGLGGVSFADGVAVASTDVHGHFQGVRVTPTSDFANYEVMGTDLLTGDIARSNILRPQVA